MNSSTGYTNDSGPCRRRAMCRRGVPAQRVICVLLSMVMVFDSVPCAALSYAAESVSEMQAQTVRTDEANAFAKSNEDAGGQEMGDSCGSAGENSLLETVRLVFYPNANGDGSGETNGHMDPYELVLDGESQTIPPNKFVRTGYRFMGWSTTPDGRDIADDPATTGVDETLTAMRLCDRQELVDLGYDEEATHTEIDSHGNEVVVSNLVPRNLTQVMRGGVIALYAQWESLWISPDEEGVTTGETGDANPLQDVRTNQKDAMADSLEKTIDASATYDARDETEATQNDGLDAPVVRLSNLGDLRALSIEGVHDANRDVMTNAVTQGLSTSLDEAETIVAPLLEMPLRSSAPDGHLPREADGSTIESISTTWITQDSVENGDDALLYVKPQGDTLTNVRMRVNYALSGEHDYEAGDVRITVPASMFVYRDGKVVDTLSIPYPEEPKTSNDFNWTRKGDTYVLKNTRKMQAATKGYIEFEVPDLVPHRVIDMAQSEPFWASIEITTHRGNSIGLVSNEIWAQLDTEEVVESASEFCSDVSVVDASSIPEAVRAEGESQYVLVTWYHYANVLGNTEFMLDVWDKRADDYEGVMVSPVVGDQDVSERIYEGYWGPMVGYKTVTYAYPLSQFEPNVTYTFKNDVGYTLTEVDPAIGSDPQKVTHAQATASIEWLRREQAFVVPEGNLLLTKQGNDGANGTDPAPYATHYVDEGYWSGQDYYTRRLGIGIYPYALNNLRDGHDVEVAYTVETSGHLLPWTLDGDPRKISDYGKRPVTLVTYDTDDGIADALSLEGWRLTRGVDYVYKAVEFPERPTIGLAKPINLNAEGDFIYSADEDASIGYAEDIDCSHIPEITLEARVGGTWRQVAIADWSSGSLHLSCRDTLSVGNRVLLPEGTERVRTSLSSANASVHFVFRPVFTVYADGAAGTLANAAFANASMPKLALKNTSRMEATTAEGTQIGTLRAEGYDSLRGFSTDIAAIPSKNVYQSASDVDYDKRNVTLHYTARVEERSLIPDRLTYQRALADGKIVEERQGIWYDLLPKGVTPVLSTIQLRAQDYAQDIYTVEDYKGSGRTLLVVKADLTPSPTWYSDGSIHRMMDAPSISFDATYPFDAIKDYGSTIHNVIAFESLSRDSIGTVSGYGGEPDDPFSANNFLTSRAFVDELERSSMRGLDSVRAGNRFVYAGISSDLEILSAARTSLSKDVQVNDDGLWSQGTYEDKRDVYEGGRYAYRLRMMSDANTDSSNLILFDSLENFHAGTGNDEADVNAPRWQGELAYVDTSQLSSKGVAPVVYYSKVPELGLADESDPNRASATNTDLSNGAIWTRAQDFVGSLSEVRAVAIDCSKASDGSDFVLHPLDSMVAILQMRAPKGGAVKDFIAQDAHAYNNSYLTCTSTDAVLGINGDTQNFVRHDYTKVGIVEHTISVRKVWSDADNRDGLRPPSVRVQLYADGTPTGLSQTLQGDDWTARFENVPYLKDDGTKIHYSVVEDVPEGYVCAVAKEGADFVITNVHQPEVVELLGEKTWSGGEEYVPGSLTVWLQADGQTIASRQVFPDAEGRWLYRFGNQLKYRDGGVPIKYTIKESADQSKWMLQAEGINIRNVYHPFGDVRIEKEVVGQSQAFSHKRFSFAVEFSTAEGIPCAERFAYVTSDGRQGTVGNGDMVEVASGESATIKDIPHGMRYSVREEEEDGYKIASQDGSSGTVQGNRAAVAHFTNVYKAKGSVSLAAKKILLGRTLQRHQFRCEVRDSEGTILRTATNELDGAVSFGAIGYTEADAGKTFEYSIMETVRSVAGYTYDNSVYKAFVEVIDNGDSTLRTVVRYVDEQGSLVPMPLFENEYHATGEVELRAWKELIGRNCMAGEFSFELLDEQGDVIDTKPNDEHAEIYFDPIPFDESDVGKPRYFAVREVKGNDDTVIYDSSTYAYAVTATDNGDGTLSVSQQMVNPEGMWMTDEGRTTLNPAWEHSVVDTVPVFHNTLKPGSLSIVKHVNNVASGHEGDQFTFVVQLRSDDEQVPEVLDYTRHPSSSVQESSDAFTVNVEDGRFELSLRANETATFNECIPAGTSYSVYEKACDGWILVSQSNTSGTIQPRHTSVASFENRYEEFTTSVSLMGFKTLDGKAAAAEAFEFLLRDENGPIEQVRTSAGGSIVFSPIVYTRNDVGTHTYSIVEVAGEDADVVYDEHEERVTVEVVEEGSNLVASVAYDADGVSFSNVTRSGSLRICKETEGGGDPNQEFEFEVELKNTTSAITDAASGESQQQPNESAPPALESLVDKATRLVADLGKMFEPRSAYAATGADEQLFWKIDEQGTLHLSNANVDGSFSGPSPVQMNTTSRIPWYSNRNSIYSVVIDGTLAPKSTYYWFYQCRNLTDISGLANLVTNKTTNISYMFYYCEKLEDISAVANWDTSSVVGMGSVFYGCSSLTDISPLKDWSLESVGAGRMYYESINHMFTYCRSLADISVLANWDTSNIQYFDGIFSGCPSLVDISPLRNWNTNNAISFAELFKECTGIQSIEPIRGWHTGNVRWLAEMFRGCSSLASIDPLSQWDTASVKYCGYLFSGCQRITDISALSHWDTRSVTQLDLAFDGCASIRDFTPLASWKTSNLERMDYIFRGCKYIENLDFLSGWDVSKCYYLSYLFCNCTALRDITGIASWRTVKADVILGVFSGCTSLTDVTPISNWSIGTARYIREMFFGCTSLRDVSCLSGWDTRSVIGMSRVFDNCPNLECADISGWDLSRITTVSDYPSFRNDIRLKRLTVSAATILSNNVPIPEHSAQDGYKSTWTLEGTDVVGKTAREMTNIINNHQSTGTWVWEIDPQAAIVEFHPNGGIINGETRIVQTGAVTPVSMPVASRPGFELVEWNTSADGTGESYAASGTIIPVTGKTTTLYAQWEDSSSFVDYVVMHRMESSTELGCFELAGKERRRGSWKRPIMVYPNEYEGFDAPEPQVVNLAQDGSSTVTFNYLRSRFDVTLDGNGVAENQTQRFVQGVRQELSSALVVEGKIFVGWTKNKDGSGARYANNQSVSFKDATTLYAQYLDSSISSEQQGTSIVMHVKVRAGETVSIPGIAAGTTYEVREISVPRGWTEKEVTRSRGTIEPNKATTVTAKNVYSARGTFDVCAFKSLQGDVLEDGAFDFVLERRTESGDWEAVETVSNRAPDTRETIEDDALGLSVLNPYRGMAPVWFNDIPIASAGTHSYRIREVAGSDSGLQYDTHESHVTVVATDNYDGTLRPTVTQGEDDLVFRNRVMTGAIEIEKQIEESEAASSDAQFGFEISLYNKQGVPLAGSYPQAQSTSGEGAQGSTYVNFVNGKAKVYLRGGDRVQIGGLPKDVRYEIAEDPLNGWTLVSSSGETGMVSPNAISHAVFLNRYDASGQFEIVGNKVCRGLPLVENEYSFVLYDEENKVVSRATNDSDGAIHFGPLPIDPFWAGTTRAYRVVEENTGEKYVRYDSHVEIVNVAFSDDGAGHLHADASYDGDGCVFVNEFSLAMPSTGFANSSSPYTWIPVAAFAVLPSLITSRRRYRADG